MNIHLGWPQSIYVGLIIISLLLTAKDHGKPRKPENFWTTVIALCITLPLLIWGGFFR